jgi:hypothetical protein
MQKALMLRGLRVLAVSVPILVSLAVSIVLAAQMTTNIKPTMTSQTRDLAPIQSDIVRVFAR